MPKPTPELKKKWEHIFYQFFDTNRNKVIDWNDFELLFEKVKELRGEDSAEFKIVSDAMLMVWKGLLHEIKDIDITSTEETNTAEITVDEWSKMWENYNPRQLSMWQREYLKYMFFLLDSNGDKIIDKEEYGVVLGMFGVSKDDAAKCYEKLVNQARKNKLDYGAFVHFWNEYFTSDETDAAGNFLFGTV